MINQRIFIALFCCCAAQFISAQSALNFGMKAGYLKGNLHVYSSNIITTDNNSYDQSGNGTVAMFFNLPMKKKFRLGAEIGLNTYAQLLQKTFDFGSGVVADYTGRYRINQAYFAVAPEYRIKDWLYVNVGGGYYADLNSSFTDGYRTGISFPQENITGWSYKRYNQLGYFAGIGLCPNLTKELAVLLEVRYNVSSATPFSSLRDAQENADQIGIGYRAIGINVGLVYKPQL